MRLDVDAEPRVHLSGRERATPACVSLHELAQRIRPALEKCIRQARGRHQSERVAVAACILGRDQPLVSGDAHTQRAPLGLEDRRVRLVELADSQVTAQPQQIVQVIRIRRKRSQRRLDLGECITVDQLAQLLLTEQLAQKIAIERERLRTPFGRRRVVLVHVGRDVVEEERRRERRRARTLDVDQIDLPCMQAVQQRLQGR